jgi:hypothetical protein
MIITTSDVLKLGARRYIGTLPLHCALLKTAKLRARINSESGADFLTRECLGEAGFEVYCSSYPFSSALFFVRLR